MNKIYLFPLIAIVLSGCGFTIKTAAGHDFTFIW